MKRFCVLSIICLISILAAGCGGGRSTPLPTLIPPPTLDPQGGNVRGIFLGGGAPLASHEVMLSRVEDFDALRFAVSQITLTNEYGEFVFTGVTPGAYVISLALGIPSDPGARYELNPQRIPRGYVLTEDKSELRLFEVEAGKITDIGEVRLD